MKRLLFLSTLIVAGCASNKTSHILPGPEGVHEAMARDTVKEEAESTAIDRAKNFCASQGHPIEILEHSVSYAGNMDESTRNTIRTSSQVAMAAGAVVAVAEPEKRDLASSAVAAGAAGYVSTNNPDYLAKVHFRCIEPSLRHPNSDQVRPWPYW